MAKKIKAETNEPRLQSSATDVAPAVPEAEDYLRQYQYRKQTQPGSKASDPVPGSKAAIMKKVLLAQPRIRMYVPRPQGEHKSVPCTVTLNGYRLDLPKNTYIDVPKQVADVIMESQRQTEEAIARNQIAGDSRKETALV